VVTTAMRGAAPVGIVSIAIEKPRDCPWW